MLQRQVVCHVCRQQQWWRSSLLRVAPGMAWRRGCLRCLARLGVGAGLGARRCRCPGSVFAGQVTAFLVVPAGLVVGAPLGVVAREKAVLRKLESILDYKRGIGEIDKVVLGDTIVLESVADQPAEKRNVRSCPDLQEQVSISRRAREPRID